jgi:hypothetical protein
MTNYELLQQIVWRVKEVRIQTGNIGDVSVDNVVNVIDEVHELAKKAQELSEELSQRLAGTEVTTVLHENATTPPKPAQARNKQ